MYSPEQYTTDDWTIDEYTPLRNDDVIANYTKKVTDRNNYSFSLDQSMDLAAMSMTVPRQDDSGIPQDMGDAPLTTPNINLEEQEEPKGAVLERLWNSSPEWLQKVLTPFLVPFTNNPVARGITIGIPEGINGTLNLLRDINNAMHPDNQFSEEEWLQIPEIIERGDAMTENIVSGLTQFFSVYAAAGKINGIQKLPTQASKIWNDMWRAGLADAAFDPEDGNLATFINMLDEDTTALGIPFGKMNGPFTQWLGTPVGEDAEAWERVEQRLKNLLEGAGLGLLFHGAAAAIKGVKGYMIESDPDKYFAMLKKAGFNVDPRQFLIENTIGAENLQTPKLNELDMYSQLEKVMINLTQDKNKPEDLLRYLTKNGVSNAELENSGVLDLINDKKAAGESVTKDEVMEVFTDMDVTQSVEVKTRTYKGDFDDLDNMADEEDLLEIYQYNLDGGTELYGPHENASSVNGKVLEADSEELYDYRGTGSVADDQKRIMEEFESGGYDGTDGIQLFEKLQELYPETYPKGMENNPDALDEFYLKLGSIKGGNNYQPAKHSNPDEFRQHVEEAVEKMAMDNYQANPTFQWELNQEFFRYKITGNETDGYRVEVHSQTIGGGQVDELDVSPTATEAMVRVQGYEKSFGSGRHDTSTRWAKLEGKWNIVHADAVDTYKEKVITADSPSGTVFGGGQAHFPEKNKVFHLRTTEPNANTLYIEELQSDWAGDISKKGVKKGDETSLQSTVESNRKELIDYLNSLNVKDDDLIREINKPQRIAGGDPTSQHLISLNTSIKFRQLKPELQEKAEELLQTYRNNEQKLQEELLAVPQSPLPDEKWISVGLRTAIADAINAGKTRVEWTPSKIHIDRWEGHGEKMFKVLYDVQMPSIAKKIANKYNSKAGKHYIEINDEMIKHHKSGKGDKFVSIAQPNSETQYA
jgi:hypothetical protein